MIVNVKAGDRFQASVSFFSLSLLRLLLLVLAEIISALDQEQRSSAPKMCERITDTR